MMGMTFYAITALVNLLTSLFLSIYLVFHKPYTKAKRSFALFLVSIMVWSVGYFFWQFAQTEAKALFWSQILMAGAIFVPILYLRFTLFFLNIYERRKYFFYIGFLMFCGFLLWDFTPLFISHVEPAMNFPYWPKPGVLFHPFLALWFLYFLYSFYLLYQAYRTSEGLIRIQIRYILLMIIFCAIGGSTNYFLWYNIPIPPIGNIFASVVNISVYAIVRSRLADIRIFARKVLIYVALSAFLYGLFYALNYIYSTYLGGVFTGASFASTLVIAPLFAYFIYNAIKWIDKVADRYIFSDLFNYRQTITELARNLSNSPDLNYISDAIITTLQSALRINTMAILFHTEQRGYKILKSAGFDSTDKFFVSDAAEYIGNVREPIVVSELMTKYEAQQVSTDAYLIINFLKNHGIEVCLPLFSNKRHIGFLLLGTKISGDAYTANDLETLTTLTYQAGIALENAELFTETQEFNTTLQAKVKEQTKDIQAKADRLEKLVKVKSDFINLISHQLRTPVTIISGASSILREESHHNLTEDEQKLVESIYVKSRQLGNIFNDIIIASEVDVEHFTFPDIIMQKIRFERIVETVFDDERARSTEKKLEYEYIPPASPLPEIKTNPAYLQIAIRIIIDNAIMYTAAGKVSVAVAMKDTSVVCTVSDTGVGISEEDQKQLFQKFIRGKNAVDSYAYGTGLGLFIAKKIIEAHPGGKLEYSTEVGKGTTFTISIPVV
jgi:signal transduction histidine kinase